MNVQQYLKRIGYTGATNIDRACLDKLMAHHLNSIIFENINQQLGIPVTLGLEDAFKKIVINKRGGWCFELNHLFYQVLKHVGFDVQMLAGFIGDARPEKGDVSTHMFLTVNLGDPLLVDVGFGGGMHQPLAVGETTVDQSPYIIKLSPLSDKVWQYSETSHGNSSSFTFDFKPVDLKFFEQASKDLQTNEHSPFVKTLTAQRRYPGKHLILRGCVLSTVTPQAKQEKIIDTVDEFDQCLKDNFNLDIPQIRSLWPRIVKRHQQLKFN